MNRILLIGNGFDLAHDLKTRYKDFIDDFWELKANTVLEKYIENAKPSSYQTYNINFSYIDADIEIREDRIKYNFTFTPSTVKRGYEFFLYILSSFCLGKTSSFLVKNKFLEQITQKSMSNWVDIEVEYYSELKKRLKNEKEGSIEQLNIEFQQIKNALIIYLKKLDTENLKLQNSIYNLIDYIIEVDGSHKDLIRSSKNETLFLNFNYTDTISPYFTFLKLFLNDNTKNTNNKIKYYHIHGSLEDTTIPIIFGYDNEKDDIIEILKNNPNSQWLENIKSINYSNSYNYKNLLSFIKKDEYTVYILGHSCGISDCTILSQIFDNINCKEIKIFYHLRNDNTDDYSEKIKNISRMFSGTALMNAKITPKQDCVPLSNIPKMLPETVYT